MKTLRVTGWVVEADIPFECTALRMMGNGKEHFYFESLDLAQQAKERIKTNVLEGLRRNPQVSKLRTLEDSAQGYILKYQVDTTITEGADTWHTCEVCGAYCDLREFSREFKVLETLEEDPLLILG